MAVKLENKQTNIKVETGEGVSVKLSYFSMILTVIGRQAVSTAWTIDEIKSRLDVLDILEASKDAEFVMVTEASLAFIKQEVKEAKWTLAHRDIVQFHDYIVSL